VRPFPSGSGKWQISGGGASQPRWSRDGKEIHYLQGDALMAVQVSTEGAFTVGAAQRLFSTGNFETSDVSLKYDTLPGGHFLLIEPVEAEGQQPQQIYVVENWLKALRLSTQD
jgi:hypothetical protein